MAVPEIVEAQAWHVKPIADRMRSADRKEMAALGYSPEVSMKVALSGAEEAWTGLIDGNPVCMFGVNSSSALSPHRGIPWMMGTESLDRHAILFLKRCKPQVDRMQSLFSLLENWIAVENVVAVAWLRWLGFSFHEGKTIGGMKFIRFTREASVEIYKGDHKKEKFKAAIEATEEVMTNVRELYVEETGITLEITPVHFEPEHHFAEGLYSRTMTVPKGTMFSSVVHLHENFAFIMQGVCVVESEEGKKVLRAPSMFKTLAGTKRLIKIVEDCVWTTVHALPPELGEDIDKIEKYFGVGTLDEYNKIVNKKKGCILCE